MLCFFLLYLSHIRKDSINPFQVIGFSHKATYMYIQLSKEGPLYILSGHKL